MPVAPVAPVTHCQMPTSPVGRAYCRGVAAHRFLGIECEVVPCRGVDDSSWTTARRTRLEDAPVTRESSGEKENRVSNSRAGACAPSSQQVPCRIHPWRQTRCRRWKLELDGARDCVQTNGKHTGTVNFSARIRTRTGKGQARTRARGSR